MRVVVVYGNERKGSTYNCVKILKETMKNCGDVEFVEFFLPKDLPYFCKGCFNCFLKGEEHCPHYESVKPIVEQIVNSDAIILASPVYGLNVSGAMKTFIDHLCYMWMPHRPKEEMFSKIGMVISTTAGMGTKTTNKTMARALKYMGIKRIFSYGTSVAATKWEDVKPNKKVKIEKELNKKGIKLYKTIKNRRNVHNRLFTRILFFMMKGMIKSYEDGNYDKEYWRSKGWLNEKKPFIS